LAQKKILKIFVKLNCKKPFFYMDGEELIFCATERPVENRVNRELLKLISKKIGVPPKNVRIVRGLKSREKILEIILPDKVSDKDFQDLLLGKHP
jgi:uncharacterized protein YggU (UPF0235/DUF167 family)